MSKDYFDNESGKYLHQYSDDLLIDSDGNTYMLTGENTAVGMESGEMLFISPVSDDGDDF